MHTQTRPSDVKLKAIYVIGSVVMHKCLQHKPGLYSVGIATGTYIHVPILGTSSYDIVCK